MGTSIDDKEEKLYLTDEEKKVYGINVNTLVKNILCLDFDNTDEIVIIANGKRIVYRKVKDDDEGYEIQKQIGKPLVVDSW